MRTRQRKSWLPVEFLQSLLHIETILEQIKEYEEQMGSEDQEKSEKNSAEKKKTEDLRMKAMETFAETKKNEA